jgi:hypothetical protein
MISYRNDWCDELKKRKNVIPKDTWRSLLTDKNNEGYTVLELALKNHQAEQAKFLLEMGYAMILNYNPLQCITEHNKERIIQSFVNLFSQALINKNMASGSILDLLEIFLHTKIRLRDIKDKDGNTLVMQAAYKENFHFFTVLITMAKKCDYNILAESNNKNENILHFVAKMKDSNAKKWISFLLKQYSSNFVSDMLEQTNSENQTPYDLFCHQKELMNFLQENYPELIERPLIQVVDTEEKGEELQPLSSQVVLYGMPDDKDHFLSEDSSVPVSADKEELIQIFEIPEFDFIADEFYESENGLSVVLGEDRYVKKDPAYLVKINI